MAKTAASDVWHKPIKAIGNGYIDLIMRCQDQNATRYAGQQMELHDDGTFTIFATGSPDAPLAHAEVAEDIADDDTYFLGRKYGAQILHNQKLAGAYQIGTAVYKTGAGTWTVADKDTAASLLQNFGIVCGPADRITSGAVKDIDDALSATEPVDICM